VNGRFLLDTNIIIALFANDPKIHTLIADSSEIFVPCNAETAKKYGEIKNRLKEKGHPIPENDIWIAAIAQQYALTLVTRDAHFEGIENLKIEVW